MSIFAKFSISKGHTVHRRGNYLDSRGPATLRQFSQVSELFGNSWNFLEGTRLKQRVLGLEDIGGSLTCTEIDQEFV